MTPFNDRLYRLIPAIYRIRDSEIGEPLRALLSVISTEVDVVERDMEQLYDNWFIETCEDWAIPYIGDLVGHSPVLPTSGDVTDPHVRERNRWLFPRREIANIVRHRRRKGTLLVLEDLSRDIAGWPASAREPGRYLAHFSQQVSGRGEDEPLRLQPGNRMADLREQSVDVDRIPRLASSKPSGTTGRSPFHQVELTVWQMPVHSMTETSPFDHQRYLTFHPLGLQTPLYNSTVVRETARFGDELPPEELVLHGTAANRPGLLSRQRLASSTGGGIDPAFYGPGKAFLIQRRHAGGLETIPASRIDVEDLSDDHLEEARRRVDSQPERVLVDPETGRLLVAQNGNPPGGKPTELRVSFHYAFSSEMGGGEYSRPIDPERRGVTWSVSPEGGPFRIRPGQEAETMVAARKGAANPTSIDRAFLELAAELAKEGQRRRASGENRNSRQKHRPENREFVLQLSETGVYRVSDDLNLDGSQPENPRALLIRIPADVVLEIRSGVRTCPVLRSGREIQFELEEGASLTLDGLWIATPGLTVRSSAPNVVAEPEGTPRRSRNREVDDPRRVVIRHCTLASNEPVSDSPLSRLTLETGIASVLVDHSVVGTVRGPARNRRPQSGFAPSTILRIRDSILGLGRTGITKGKVDRILRRGVVISGPYLLQVERSTLLGNALVRQVEEISNSIVLGALIFDRLPSGTIRFSHVRLREELIPATVQCLPVLEEGRLQPTDFESVRFGTPGFARLRRPRLDEQRLTLGRVRVGADDGGEMGVFHDVFTPHREAALRRRLDEFTPATHEIVIRYITAIDP